jgi:hypothetical protein
MAVGSGLGAQLVIGQESAYGTGATLDHSYEFDNESIARTPTWLDDDGLHGGGEFHRAARTSQSVIDVAGSIPMSFVTNKMGLLVKHMLGSTITAPTVITGTANKQVHQPGGLTGLSLSAQVGRPRSNGTVDPYTAVGGKIVQWALSCSAQQLLKLALDFNFEDIGVATGLAAYAPVATAASFTWRQAALKLGGTASTTTGVVSIAGGAAMTTLVTGFTLTGTNPQNVGRFGLGGNGLKSEPVSNALRGYGLALQGEYTNQAELYTPFAAGTTVPAQLTFTGGAIGVSGSNYTVDIVIPATKVKQASPNVAGPDVLQQQATLDIYDDGVNAPIQVTITSDDTTL